MRLTTNWLEDRLYDQIKHHLEEMCIHASRGGINPTKTYQWLCRSSLLLGRPLSTISLVTNCAPRTLHTTSTLRSAEGLSQHRDTPDNNPATPFDFSEENYAEVKRIIAKYPKNYQQSAVIPLLHLAQRQYGGWLPIAAMNKVAKILDMPPMRVYEGSTLLYD
jgi:hypothetical protein